MLSFFYKEPPTSVTEKCLMLSYTNREDCLWWRNENIVAIFPAGHPWMHEMRKIRQLPYGVLATAPE